MAREIHEQIDAYGYAHLPSFGVEQDFISIANGLGKPLEPWKDGLVQTLLPKESATPNTYSGIFGINEFPYHTDLAHWRLPPRYLVLRCEKGYPEVPTLLLDSNAILDTDTIDTLMRAVVKPRRPINGQVALRRLCERTQHGNRIRWDQVFLVPACRIAEIAVERVKSLVTQSKPVSIALTEPGEILIIDNWRMLHSRANVPVERLDRTINRVYLEALA